jgi:hypothetical protein
MERANNCQSLLQDVSLVSAKQRACPEIKRDEANSQTSHSSSVYKKHKK